MIRELLLAIFKWLIKRFGNILSPLVSEETMDRIREYILREAWSSFARAWNDLVDDIAVKRRKAQRHIVGTLNDVLSTIAGAIETTADTVLPDTTNHRRRVAKRLMEYADNVQRGELAAESLVAISRAAHSPSGFKRTYALDTLGRLGPIAADQLAAPIKGLKSYDPFVRDAAAQALYRIGATTEPVRNALVRVLKKYKSEGCARYAVLALARFDDLSESELKVLKHIATARDSYAAQEAEGLYEQRSGPILGGNTG